jgi:quinohemoprotein ethanol dehydrogenase
MLPSSAAAQTTANDWPSHGRDAAESRYSPLASINTTNIKRLGLAWSYDTQTVRGLEATPLVVNGVLYATASWSVVFALDARTGKQLWRYDPEVPRSYGQRACCDVVNRGVAYYDGKVFAGILDGRLVALNAATGKVLWQTQTTDRSQPYTITGAPRVVKGKVIIGNGGSEYGVRGYVSAFDSATGKIAWRFYTVPGDPSMGFESPAMERAAKTWSGEWWKMGGGGTAWDALAWDPEADLLYVGTGNGSPWIRELRSPNGGDNLYLASILALRPDTGELVWHYQTTPGETWDYTAAQQMILADLDISGRRRQVLMQAPKNGFFYVLDRRTGELLSADPFAKVTWATHVDLATGRPVEVPGARYESETTLIWPGPGGAHNWHPMSFHPGTGLVYIPVQEAPFPYSRDPNFKYRRGEWNFGIAKNVVLAAEEPVPTAPGYLLAWDPRARKERWRVPHKTTTNGGTLATAGGLVFQGTADGRFVAYHATSGEKLWEVTLGNGIVAAPVTYELNGRQYVSVLAGWGGADGLILGLNASGAYKAPGRLWTFSLDGGQPIVPVRSQAKPRLVDVSSTATADQVKRGMLLYGETCAFCHGIAAFSGGVISDLRYSAPAVFAKYRHIVLDGTYLELGMPSFRSRLTEADVELIRAFVLSQRSKLAASARK